MTASPSGLEPILSRLGGWPDYFGDLETRHGMGMLELQVRRRGLDEAVFGIVVRYAVHRAAYDRLSKSLADRRDEDDRSDFMSGGEQQRAYHKRELLTLERELLVTPGSRAKADLSLQSDFLEQLEASGTEGRDGKVLPWRPLARKRAE